MDIDLLKRNPLRTRIAPTPSGYLHLGNGFSFLYSWLLARKLGGEVGLRIDDLDKGRKREEYVEDIFQTLNWLGMDWDTGPKDSANFEAAYSQHLRLERYQQLLEGMKDTGMLYACDCSRKKWKMASDNGLYPNTCRERPLDFGGAAVAWRVWVDETSRLNFQDGFLGKVSIDLASEMGDFVVRKKDRLPSYQVGSLVDDLEAGTTLIVRGEDLLASSGAQMYLAQNLGEERFGEIAFIHHPLLLSDSGEKLSKSEGAPALFRMREQEGGKESFLKAFQEWLGMESSSVSLGALLEAFDPQRHFPRVKGMR